MPAIGEEALIDDVQRRLVQKYADLSPGDVSAAVEAALIRFERSSIRDFVPLLVERRASAQLSEHDELPPAVERQPSPESGVDRQTG